MANIYDYEGNIIDISGGGTASAIDYDKFVKGIAHRGYSTVAPDRPVCFIGRRRRTFAFAIYLHYRNQAGFKSNLS